MNRLSWYALVLTGASATAAFAGACSSSGDTTGGPDDSGANDAAPDTYVAPLAEDSSPGAPDSNPPPSVIDSALPDTSTPVTDDAGPDDTGAPTPDAGEDSSTPDQDSSTPDAADAAAPFDAGTDSTTTDDAGDDASDDAATPEAGDDSGSDASATDGAAEAGGVSFANPIQIDVSSLLNANTVVTTATGGLALSAMDGTANSGANNDFPTQSEALALNTSGVGLADNAFYASNGTTIPNVQLAWSNSVNQKNSMIVAGNNGAAHTFSVPAASYSQVQFYATGGSGGASLSIVLTYATGTPVTTTMPLPDWCTGTPSAGEFILASVDRVQNGNTFSGGILCHIYAINLNPDSTRTLTQVSITDQGTGNDYLVFYGATAW